MGYISSALWPMCLVTAVTDSRNDRVSISVAGSHGHRWLEKSLGNSETGVVTGRVCPHLSERGAMSDNSWQEGLTVPLHAPAAPRW